jgi:hypothetical protein
MLVPPFPKGGKPGDACGFPSCFIQSAIEFPPPAIVFDLSPSTARRRADGLLPPQHQLHDPDHVDRDGLHPAAGLRRHAADEDGPGPAAERRRMGLRVRPDFAVGIGGEKARRYYPIFAAFFIFILFSNWSGLVPPIGKIEQLRAPTSDVNVTIGLALTSFVIFQGEGFRRLGVRGYLASSSRSASSATASGPGSWPCTSGSSSSSWSS